MPKIKLGARPKTFEHTLKVKLTDGTEGVLPLTYRYRTRTEFGEFIDGLFRQAKVTPASTDTEDVRFSLREALERTRDSNADYILQIVEGWGLDEEFSRESVVQLCDELPGVAVEIIERYRLACTEGRLGN
jgi:hypothetical protein